MAASLNKVFLIGNLTRDPELRYLTSGRAVTNFSLAVNRSYTTQSGEKKEEVAYVRVVTWDKRAEVINEYLENPEIDAEGRKLIVEKAAGPFHGNAGKMIGDHILSLAGCDPEEE